MNCCSFLNFIWIEPKKKRQENWDEKPNAIVFVRVGFFYYLFVILLFDPLFNTYFSSFMIMLVYYQRISLVYHCCHFLILFYCLILAASMFSPTISIIFLRTITKCGEKKHFFFVICLCVNVISVQNRKCCRPSCCSIYLRVFSLDLFLFIFLLSLNFFIVLRWLWTVSIAYCIKYVYIAITHDPYL